MTKEIWIPLVHPKVPKDNKYLISTLGRIISNSKNYKKTKYLTGTKSKKGYIIVGICVNYNLKKLPVHRLVAYTFLSNPHNFKQVNHKNGIKKDNRKTNLEWCDQSYNQKHAIRTGLKKMPTGEAAPASKLKKVQVLKIFKSEMTNTKLARMYNVSETCISAIKLGRTWFHITKKKYTKHKFLSEKEVLAIFNSTGSCESVAKLFGVSIMTISDIRRGKSNSKITGKIYIKKCA